ncbi:MAG: major facilitator superfamily domain-containing protein 1 [Ignavibacteria bacterium]|nr:major facilitator superfamily domain-containing protein 1 [Ignavibacteria bacterium]
MVLVFISLTMFGNYYVYDSAAPIFDLLKDQLSFSDQDLGLLYSVYSVAAILVLLFGGYIIDRFGTKISILAFGAICLVAAFVTALSPELTIMLIGRFILGLGAEPLIVAVTTALAKWFKGKELSFAFGINLMIARLGSVSADWSPAWARSFYTNWQDPLWLATAIAGTCVAGGMLYWVLEQRAEKRYSLGRESETEKLDLKNLYRFSKSYWYVVALCVVFYSTVFPFRAFAIKYFIEAHGTSREVGGLLNSFLPFAAMIATPLFGYMVDRIGKRSLFMMFGSILLLPLFLMATYLPPGAPVALSLPFFGEAAVPLTLLAVMLTLGIAFSLIPAIMWPSVAYIVEENRLGSAYSLMTLCQQVGMAAIPWLIGVTNDAFDAGPANPDGYAAGMWIFTGLASLGLLFSFLLWRTERGPTSHGLETITTTSSG